MKPCLTLRRTTGKQTVQELLGRLARERSGRRKRSRVLIEPNARILASKAPRKMTSGRG